ncbi:BTAD domain-containing putative transcriptional regulator [Pseudonocardia spinosispora]|uniref:BTAD domain-containing putative transcriptional regulator n=1 Tax=Pseudonocardia spinosispora TaxID=103441 RepID=UPI000404DCD4|nr:BTAD domain-containing putative transcriptional regulator [Pseudonocardia spinosispora]
MSFKFCILGPVRVWRSGLELTAGSPQQKAILTLLLLHRGRYIPSDALIEKVWGANPPASANSTVRVYISRLRKLLAGTSGRSAIHSDHSGGYSLELDPADEFDLVTLDNFLDEALHAREAGDPSRAARLLSEALSIWQSPSLGGARGAFVDAERRRLEDLRIDTREKHVELHIDLGNCARVLPELEELVRIAPFNERLRALQMLALYRSAQQADALAVYRDLRHLLRAELGIEPNHTLQDLNQRILEADPALMGTNTQLAPKPTLRLAESRESGVENPPARPARTPSCSAVKGIRSRLSTGFRENLRRSFVGRAPERASFSSALNDGPTKVLFFHGPRGIGKSTLLRYLADEAEQRGRNVAYADARMVKASGFAFFDFLRAARDDPNSVVLIDNFEQCQEFESRLHEELLPEFADGAIIVLAGHNPPSMRWQTDTWWTGLLEVHRLRDLSDSETREFLSARGCPRRHLSDIVSLVGGNPLGLALAAADRRNAQSFAGEEWKPKQGFVHELLMALVDATLTPEQERTLQVCAQAHVTTPALLRTVLNGSDSSALFAWLCSQPYTAITDDGVRPYGIARRLINADLRARDPEYYREISNMVRSYGSGYVQVRSLEKAAGT